MIVCIVLVVHKHQLLLLQKVIFVIFNKHAKAIQNIHELQKRFQEKQSQVHFYVHKSRSFINFKHKIYQSIFIKFSLRKMNWSLLLQSELLFF